MGGMAEFTIERVDPATFNWEIGPDGDLVSARITPIASNFIEYPDGSALAASDAATLDAYLGARASGLTHGAAIAAATAE